MDEDDDRVRFPLILEISAFAVSASSKELYPGHPQG